MNVDRVAIVTTSWDDGHILDLRLAELLTRYGLTGTFYVPLRHPDFPVLNAPQMLQLRQMGMEIGSHTATHGVLTRMPLRNAERELVTSKQQLEELLGEPVLSFCYPHGSHNRTICRQVAAAGYRLGRTTKAFRTDLRFDPMAMPVSLQAAGHSIAVHLRHALKEWNFRGLTNWWRTGGAAKSLPKLARRQFDAVLRDGGIFHLWGHSWEIEALGLWETVEDICAYIGRRAEVHYTTNLEALNWLAPPMYSS